RARRKAYRRMTNDLVTAPGKIILSGEYAVLRDAPAVVMAVDRRAKVSVVPHNEPWWVVRTPGYEKGAWRFEYGDSGNIRWLDELPSAGLRLLETVFSQATIGPVTPSVITIDTSAFLDAGSGTKLGLGSSAAATVALTAALFEPTSDIRGIWSSARRAHEAMQGGSGVDIAASCFGGLLHYRRKDESPPATLDWPESISFRIFFSGVSTSTRSAIEAAGQSGQLASSWSDLISAAADSAAAWQEGDAANILSSMRRYTRQLAEFDAATNAGIFSFGHEELCAAGAALGIVYKPCGAGGGDCGIALSTDIALLEKFSAVAEAQGFVPLDAGRDNRGL
ncbi:MAG: hypothetical protein OEM63_11430, partial [Gammaproteobacteria bacterium]|nr:hypothetical protein [Gammaproteobacteria bacterium]